MRQQSDEPSLGGNVEGAQDPTSGPALTKWLLKYTATHPTTTFPLALGVLAILWIALQKVSLTPVFIGFGAFLIGVGAWVVNFFIRGEALVERHLQELRAQRQAQKEEELAKIESLCNQASFYDGAKEAGELKAAYQKLLELLDGRRGQKSMVGAEGYRILAEETFRQGMQMVNRGLLLHTALQSVDVDKLEREMTQWKRQLSRATNRNALERQIAQHQSTLDTYNRQKDELAKALSDCNGLETALTNTHLELAKLLTSEELPDTFRSDAKSDLERRVEAARRVETRLNNLGRQDTSADDVYREAGKSKK